MSTAQDNRFYRQAHKKTPVYVGSLKACPFCGEAIALGIHSPRKSAVLCGICLTEGPQGDSPQVAREGWNTRTTDHSGVRMLMTRNQADHLLSHLCELEQHFDLNPDGAAQLDLVRRLLADSIVEYDRAQRGKTA